jgi:DNA phosphorothioation-associated putative methyltransferase
LEEIKSGPEIVENFGSLGRAFGVIEVVTDREEWLQLTERRRIDLMVYLALKFFDGDYRMSDLASVTQRDVRSHFQSLSKATEVARKLLFGVGSLDNISLACRSSTVGKLTPSALYVHVDALEHLPGILKVYEGCARRLVGDVPGANLIKLHRDSMKISYLSYPDFDVDPHPALHQSDIVDLIEQTHRSRRYPKEANVPILHRKEEFLHSSDPRAENFRVMTEREVAAGLFADSSRIGYREQWNALLSQKGFKYFG